MAGLHDDQMLQKLYEKENLLTLTLDQVLTLARTLKGAKESVIATRDRSDGQREMPYVTRKSPGKRSVGRPGGSTRRSVDTRIIFSGRARCERRENFPVQVARVAGTASETLRISTSLRDRQ